MTPEQKLKLLRATAEEKAKFIDEQLLKLEKLMDKLGVLLNKQILDSYLNELSVENGIILTDVQNQRKSALIDKAYDFFMQKNGYKVVTTMIEDLYAVSGMNADYFSELQGMKINASDIEETINTRLGLNNKGELKRDGFMKGLMDNPSIKDEIKNYVLDKTISGTGYEDLRNGLRDLITGNEEKMGNFKQFYRNTAYDTYARIDALNGKLYGDKIGLNYFIYAGTRRKASRHFCIHKKGKVFSRDEALEWKNLIGTTTTDEVTGKRVLAGPIVAREDIATYNPFVDRGGYGCVDDIMWVSDEIAMSMRPELKTVHNNPSATINEPIKKEVKEKILASDPLGVNVLKDAINTLSKKMSPSIRKKIFDKLVDTYKPIYVSKSKNGGSIFTVEGSRYNLTELDTAKSLAESGQHIIFPNDGFFDKRKGNKVKRNDIFAIDTKTYYQQKIELKALTGKSADSIAKQLQKGQAPVVAYDILSTIKKMELINGLRLGWNSDIKKVLIKWNGRWYEFEKDNLFSSNIYKYLK